MLGAGRAIEAGLVQLNVFVPTPAPPVVEYLVDGAPIARVADVGGTYPLLWDSNTVRDGQHSVRVEYLGTDGSLATTPPTTVTISNHVRLGAALGAQVLTTRDSRYPSTFLSYFDSFTPEHEMKWFAVEPRPGRFDFKASDAMVDWALAHGKTVHGHNLVWYDKLPSWLTQRRWTRDELLAVLRRHILTVVGHFRGRVGAWDVVNEPLNDDGSLMHDLFEQVIGPGYIADALRWAHEADPNALLYINEYGTETINPKSNALLAIARRVLASGVPLNGIGFQMHVSLGSYPSAAELEDSMARFADLGLRTDVTEMDVKTESYGGSMADRVQAEADVYAQAAAGCAAVPACTSFTTWGVSDAMTWLGSEQAPLMFDQAFQPKAAYYAVVNGLKARQ